MDLENRRQLLERLDLIEYTLTNRVTQCTQWIPNFKSEDSFVISARECAVRRLDASYLVKEYNRVLNLLKEPFIKPLKSSIDEDLTAASQCSDLKVSNNNEFEKLGDRGLQRLVCRFTNQVLNDIETYNQTECYGMFIDLTWSYEGVMASDLKVKPENYKSYLQNLLKFEFNQTELVVYMKRFYEMTCCVGDADWDRDVPLPNRNYDDELFCVNCHKTFERRTVFDAHKSGRRHKRALNLGVTLTALVNALQPVVDRTVTNLDRRAQLSVNEKNAELEASLRERELEDNYVSDNDDDDTRAKHDGIDEMFTNGDKPLIGLNGEPIPRWLFKLQGLKTVYKCEICGPGNKYPGRRTFEQHFRGERHIDGLKKMGITHSNAFNGISSIDEAKRLDKLLKREKRQILRFDKEVEDEEGNVMSERMYDDLKRQGLL